MMKTLILIVLIALNSFAIEKLKVGVLAFGTVNWELNVMQFNKIAKKHNLELEVIKLASKNAVSIALQAGAVDVIVSDFIWVSRQRAKGYDFTFYPYSKTTGALYVRPEQHINSLLDLKNKKLGVSGGSVDKTWLLLRAYSQFKYQKDLTTLVEPTFAAPPILNKKLLDTSLDATINFWHFAAKLEAKGMKRLIGMKEILPQLGINSDVTFVGWVFNDKFARMNRDIIDSFLQASYETKKLLLNSKKEWERLRPIMKVKDDVTFEALKTGYKNGVVKSFTQKNKNDAKKVFDILATQGGVKLVGVSKKLQEGTFYEFTPTIKW